MATFVGKTANSSHPTAGRCPHPTEGPTIALKKIALPFYSRRSPCPSMPRPSRGSGCDSPGLLGATSDGRPCRDTDSYAYSPVLGIYAVLDYACGHIPFASQGLNWTGLQATQRP